MQMVTTKKYYLNKNVFLVHGLIRSAIYDLNQNRLYSINNDTSQLIQRVIYNEPLELKSDFGPMVKKLIFKNIITLENIQGNSNPDLRSIINPDNLVAPLKWAWIEVTKRCNLECLHCYENCSNTRNGTMTLNDFKMVISQLQQIGVKKIQLIGGEPFVLGKKLLKMLEECVGKFDFIEVFTNGTLTTEEQLTQIKSMNVNIATSVYSYRANQHDKMTKRQGTFNKTRNMIQLLKEKEIPFRIETVNIDGIEIGTQDKTMFSIDKVGLARMSGRANLKMYNKDLLEKKIIQKSSFSRKLNLERIKSNILQHNCFSSKIYIDSSLNVFPCVMEREFLHGNIRENHISSILDENIFGLNKDKIDECKECEFRFTCFDCRPDRISGNKFSKPWYCSYLPKKGKWLDINTFINSLLNYN